ncbi:MAG: hypothetical protein A2054_08275 [Deltaproteobacteria bacterium GWA2_55_10]|nr:MAG: hypothetical protein A2054_08275 [Deltaproteobacteria bacterium GWA2_55_10]
MEAPRIQREELKEKLDKNESFTLLDVRSSHDYDSSDKRIPGSKRVPLTALEGRLGELKPGSEIVTYCA